MNGSKTLFSNRAAEAQRKKQDQKGFLNFASWRLGGENCFATVENKTILPQSRRGAKKGNKKGLKLCVFAPWRGKLFCNRRKEKPIFPQSRRGAEKKQDQKGFKLSVFAPWRGKIVLQPSKRKTHSPAEPQRRREKNRTRRALIFASLRLGGEKMFCNRRKENPFSRRAAEAQRKKQAEKGFNLCVFASWRGKNVLQPTKRKPILPQSRRGAKKGKEKV